FVAGDEKPGFQGRNRVDGDFVFALLGSSASSPTISAAHDAVFADRLTNGPVGLSLLADNIGTKIGEHLFAAHLQTQDDDALCGEPLFPDLFHDSPAVDESPSTPAAYQPDAMIDFIPNDGAVRPVN